VHDRSRVADEVAGLGAFDGTDFRILVTAERAVRTFDDCGDPSAHSVAVPREWLASHHRAVLVAVSSLTIASKFWVSRCGDRGEHDDWSRVASPDGAGRRRLRTMDAATAPSTADPPTNVLGEGVVLRVRLHGVQSRGELVVQPGIGEHAEKRPAVQGGVGVMPGASRRCCGPSASTIADTMASTACVSTSRLSRASPGLALG